MQDFPPSLTRRRVKPEVQASSCCQWPSRVRFYGDIASYLVERHLKLTLLGCSTTVFWRRWRCILTRLKGNARAISA